MSTPDMQAMKNREGASISAQVQKLGRFLSAMIMPNIGAFVAWGLITALFIGTGWLPNDSLVRNVGPMIFFMLPLLIAYTGGRMVHGQRGAVIGVIATMGVVVGALSINGDTGATEIGGTPMFLGAMIMGPFAAWVLKKFDKLIEGKIKAGFEMLVDNYSLGIIGMFLAILGQITIGPAVSKLVEWAGNGVDTLVSNNLLPLVSIIVEPAKVLFLNNAINHGVFTPLGSQEVLDNGKSILFMIETNPGPGLGLLLAFMWVGPKMLRGTIPGVAIIHFFGGIHEVYFPFILMKPKMIAATILGGMAGVMTGSLLGNGLTGPPSPGSIFAYFANSPKDGIVGMLLQVTIATVVSFVVAWFILKTDKVTREENATFDEEEAHAKLTAVTGA